MDQTEFEKLYAGCEAAIKRFVYYRMPSKADGDDVLQEALLSAYRYRESVKNTDAFKPWLLRIVANQCNDFYRNRAKHPALPLADFSETQLIQSRFGLTVAETVQETLGQLAPRDEQVLRLFFLQNMPQTEIARRLNIPVGTVKSRLYTAKQRFKSAYPFPPLSKGVDTMCKLPEYMPEYQILKLDQPPFPVQWEELMGWFIVPRLSEKRSFAMYDFPKRNRTESYQLEVVGGASVHGIDGVEIVARESQGGGHEDNPNSRTLTRTFVAQLTDTHCRILAESHYDGRIKRFYTFLDADEFLPNWGFGEENCGNEVNVVPKGIIQRDGKNVTTNPSLTDGSISFEKEGKIFTALPFLLDVVGRYKVIICGKQYDCICIMDVECYQSGVVTEQFIDQNGKTVLWRRFNRDNWQHDRYRQLWSEKLPDNEQLMVNGEIYVHWYDCMTDYIL